MKITLTAIHYKKDKKTEGYALEKVERLAKYHSKIEKARVRLFSEKAHRGQEHDFYCEIEISVPGHVITIIDTERSIDKAIDKAVERMKKTLVRHKEKHVSKEHKRGVRRKAY